jgi:hypothetical protein
MRRRFGKRWLRLREKDDQLMGWVRVIGSFSISNAFTRTSVLLQRTLSLFKSRKTRITEHKHFRTSLMQLRGTCRC